MNILVAPDSFKGSLTSVELCKVIRKSIEKVSDANVIEMPISDGGEGFLESICKMGNLKVENVLVTDPLGRRVKAEMAIDMVEKTAFIEMAWVPETICGRQSAASALKT
ncbi:MAG: glycerate kinase, partial [Lysinibacillus sp.]|nr:glycerate kinase [Lysinibacillus sp.]